MKTYEVTIFDGGSECGDTDIEATTDAAALDAARQWAEGGEWDHAGVVTLVVRHDGRRVCREQITVG